MADCYRPILLLCILCLKSLLADRQGTGRQGVRAGIIKYLEEHYDLTKIHVRGASAGALVATLAACNVDPRRALDLAHSLSVDAGLFDRKLKLAGVWGDLIRAWLYELLPSNAADLVR